MLPVSFNVKNTSLYSRQYNQVCITYLFYSVLFLQTSDMYSGLVLNPNFNLANFLNASESNDCLFNDRLESNNLITDNASEFINSSTSCARPSVLPGFGHVPSLGQDMGSIYDTSDASHVLPKNFENQRDFVQGTVHNRVSFTYAFILKLYGYWFMWFFMLVSLNFIFSFLS